MNKNDKLIPKFPILDPLKVRQIRNGFFKLTIPPKYEQMNSIFLPNSTMNEFVFVRNSRIPKSVFQINWPLGGLEGLVILSNMGHACKTLKKKMVATSQLILSLILAWTQYFMYGAGSDPLPAP